MPELFSTRNGKREDAAWHAEILSAVPAGLVPRYILTRAADLGLTVEEVAALYKNLEKYNPFHDEAGRFTEGQGGGNTISADIPEATGGGSAPAPTPAPYTAPNWKTVNDVKLGMYEKYKLAVQRSRNAPMAEKAFVEKSLQIDETMHRMTNDMPGLREAMNVPGGIIIASGKTLGAEDPNHATATGLYRAGSSFADVVVAGSLRSGEGKLKAGEWALANTFNSTLRHEIGHSIQEKVMNAMRQAGGMGFNPEESLSRQLFDANKATAAKKLSMYGASSHKEYFAESFAAYSHPDYASSKVRIDPRLEKAFDTILKKKS